MIVVKRSRGGSYILAEMDGTVSQQKVGAFRVIPSFARTHIEVRDNIYDWVDVSEEALRRIENSPEESTSGVTDFGFEGVNLHDEEEEFMEKEDIGHIKNSLRILT